MNQPADTNVTAQQIVQEVIDGLKPTREEVLQQLPRLQAVSLLFGNGSPLGEDLTKVVEKWREAVALQQVLERQAAQHGEEKARLETEIGWLTGEAGEQRTRADGLLARLEELTSRLTGIASQNKAEQQRAAALEKELAERTRERDEERARTEILNSGLARLTQQNEAAQAANAALASELEVARAGAESREKEIQGIMQGVTSALEKIQQAKRV